LLAELANVGVIGKDTYGHLKGVGGFRNVLVHEYIRVDVAEVARLATLAPKVFRDFSRDVLSWLETIDA